MASLSDEEEVGLAIQDVSLPIQRNSTEFYQEHDLQVVPQQCRESSIDSKHATSISECLDDYQCTICLEPYLDTVEASCSHCFCGFCLKYWFRTKGDQMCPVCRAFVESIHPKPEVDEIIKRLTTEQLNENQLKERDLLLRIRRADELCNNSSGLIDRLHANSTRLNTNGLPRRLEGFGYVTEIPERNRSESAWNDLRVHWNAESDVEERQDLRTWRRRRNAIAFTEDEEETNPYISPDSPIPESSTVADGISSEAVPNEEATRPVSRMEDLTRVTNDFEFHAEAARQALQRRNEADKELDDHTNHLNQLYGRLQNLGIMTTREQHQNRNTAARRTGGPNRSRTRHSLAAAIAQAPHENRQGSSFFETVDPLRAMYNQLDSVIDEALLTSQRSYSYPTRQQYLVQPVEIVNNEIVSLRSFDDEDDQETRGPGNDTPQLLYLTPSSNVSMHPSPEPGAAAAYIRALLDLEQNSTIPASEEALVESHFDYDENDHNNNNIGDFPSPQLDMIMAEAEFVDYSLSEATQNLWYDSPESHHYHQSPHHHHLHGGHEE